ncbi:MAG: hypothetical protein KZQ81_17695 [Candidatus Thiodiazotropha sp. (ex Rostrolucina anterorostrata)]|nr:hypothetical protein [Candidatus Thiodiazotropha sp. (ex Rostrolucina anterorostrata)]
MMMDASHSNQLTSVSHGQSGLSDSRWHLSIDTAANRNYFTRGKSLFRPPGRVSFLLRQKKRHQKKGRPAVTPLGGALRCSAKPAGPKLAALKQSGPLDRFFLRFSLMTGRELRQHDHHPYYSDLK